VTGRAGRQSPIRTMEIVVFPRDAHGGMAGKKKAAHRAEFGPIPALINELGQYTKWAISSVGFFLSIPKKYPQSVVSPPNNSWSKIFP
jgi:hypothetical protein